MYSVPARRSILNVVEAEDSSDSWCDSGLCFGLEPSRQFAAGTTSVAIRRMIAPSVFQELSVKSPTKL
jgi:hypothetical protein